MSKNHLTPQSFIFAFNGLKLVFQNEPNFKIQIAIGIIALILGVFFKLTYLEWAVLVIIIFLVLLLELINTALEALVDLVSPQIQEKAKMAKDAAAASVLISSILSVIIGIFLFLPKIILFLK